MTMPRIAAAMQRVAALLKRRPEAGLHDDTPATACWRSGTLVVSGHANGLQILTDMPHELGGGGDQVTPGWLLRAGLASCLTTRIAMGAAARGIRLTALEVEARSRSDVRGLLGMADAEGAAVSPGPRDMQLLVRITAQGISPERLRALVEESQRCSPVPSALRNIVPVNLRIDVDCT